MTTIIEPQSYEISAAARRHPQFRVMQVLFGGVAAIAMLALFDAAPPGDAQTVVASSSVRLVDQATDLPAPATAPFGPLFPQTPPSVVGNGGFAADDGDSDDDEAQQQEQLAMQEMQQAEQQSEEQEALDNQQAQQDEQQGLQVEEQAGQ